MGEVFESCVVGPSEETPRGALWVSNLDAVAARGFTPTVYFYRAGGQQAGTVEALKAPLGRALVRFYPLAGRLGVDRAGRVQIECTGDGTAFFAARSDSTVDDFARDFAPSPELRKRFVPSADSADPPCPLLLLQPRVPDGEPRRVAHLLACHPPPRPGLRERPHDHLRRESEPPHRPPALERHRHLLEVPHPHPPLPPPPLRQSLHK